MPTSVEQQRKQFESTVETRVHSRTKELEQKARIFGLKRTIESLQNDLFDRRQREVHHESVIKERDHLSHSLRKIKEEKDALSKDLYGKLEASATTLQLSMRQFAMLQEEKQQLEAQSQERKAALDAAREAVQDASLEAENLKIILVAEQSNRLKAESELRSLQLKYDRLNGSKKRVSAAYRRDWKRWKSCKVALMKIKENRGMIAEKLEQFFEEGCEYEKMVKKAADTHVTEEDHPAPCSSIKEEASAPEAPASSQVSMTQDWTYRDIALPAVTSAEGAQQTNTFPSAPGPSRFKTNHSTPSQCPDERKGSSPFGSPTTVKVRKEPFDRKDSNLNVDAHRLNFEVVPETPSPAKGGRQQPKTINAEFVVNEDVNAGLGFQYDAVVRNKSARKKLHAIDCECCRDYYDAVGPLPPRLQAPLWATPPKKKDGAASNPDSSPTRAEKHRQEIGRHRQEWGGPQTPPGYWEIAFPDTQEVANINGRAEEMHKKKRQQVEMEASRPNGRFRRRVVE